MILSLIFFGSVIFSEISEKEIEFCHIQREKRIGEIILEMKANDILPYGEENAIKLSIPPCRDEKEYEVSIWIPYEEEAGCNF